MSLHPIGDRVMFDGNEIDRVGTVAIVTATPDEPATPDEVLVVTTVERTLDGSISALVLPGASGTIVVEVARGRTEAHRQRISFDTTVQELSLLFDSSRGAREVLRFETVTDTMQIDQVIAIEDVPV